MKTIETVQKGPDSGPTSEPELSPQKMPLASASAIGRMSSLRGQAPARKWDELDEDDDSTFNPFPDRPAPELPWKSPPPTPTKPPLRTPPISSSKTSRGIHLAFRRNPSKVYSPTTNTEISDGSKIPYGPGQEKVGDAVEIYRATHGASKKPRASKQPQYEIPQNMDNRPIVLVSPEHDFATLHYTKDATDEQRIDMIAELKDSSRGNPSRTDLHDEVMQQFIKRSRILPMHFPARHMHLLDWKAICETTDEVIWSAFPRLSDGVATVLHQTSPKCLEDFLNPTVKVFEWQRDIRHVVIRRVGNQVLVGTYRNMAFSYVWGAYVKSVIDFTGKWHEVYGGVTKGETPVVCGNPAWDDFKEINPPEHVRPTEEKFALFMGRKLSLSLIMGKVWRWQGFLGVKHRYTVKWQADEKVTIANELGRLNGPDGSNSDEE